MKLVVRSHRNPFTRYMYSSYVLVLALSRVELEQWDGYADRRTGIQMDTNSPSCSVGHCLSSELLPKK